MVGGPAHDSGRTVVMGSGRAFVSGGLCSIPPRAVMLLTDVRGSLDSIELCSSAALVHVNSFFRYLGWERGVSRSELGGVGRCRAFFG